MAAAANNVVITHADNAQMAAFDELSKSFDSIAPGASETFEVVVMPNNDAERESEDTPASVEYSYAADGVAVSRTGKSSTHGKLIINTLDEYVRSHSAFMLEHFIWYTLQFAHMLAPLYFLSLCSPAQKQLAKAGGTPFSDVRALLSGLQWAVMRATYQK